MQKVNFNNLGLQQLLLELYGLANNELQVEALQIQEDFRQWLKVHFLMDTEQTTYLDTMDDDFLDDIATQMAYFVVQRFPISLFSAPQSLTAQGGRGKLFRSEQVAARSYSASMGSSQSQTLSFSIAYLSPENS